ncbi:MAG: hypothetical protein HZA91_04700 [Verrucomicrobia bacterium]|nr:hypothetical protein [Verrucomicrobiota bacterium]
MAKPRVKWSKLPEGWKENANPGAMRAASFLVSGDEGRTAELAVVPLSDMAGVHLQIINLWRGQVKLPPLAGPELAKQMQDVAIGADKGGLFDMAGTEPVIAGKFRARILMAMLDKRGTTWFFKLTGDDALVTKQKPAFLEFLKGISIEATGALPAGHPAIGGGAPHGAAGGPAMAAADSGVPQPKWQVPKGWEAVEHTQFLVAKFRVRGDGSTRADINVSNSEGGGGGLLLNANRWRQQLSLQPLDAAGMKKATATLDLPAGKASLLDFSGTDPESGQKIRLVAVVLAMLKETWFYKLMGHEPVVAREKESFMSFVRSAKYAAAP